MFKKVSGKKQFRKRERVEDDDEEASSSGVKSSGVKSAPPTKRRGAKFFSTSGKDEEVSDDESEQVSAVWASSRTTAPMEHRGGAFEMSEIDAPQETERKRKSDDDDDHPGDGVYRGEAGYKSYVKPRESTRKYGGTKGPIRAPQFLRNTCRFDFQPDVCKDYKDTGFCGYGDSCKFAHDRGDYKTGWQLEAEFERQKQKDRERRELRMLGKAAQGGGGGDGGGADDDDDDSGDEFRVQGGDDHDTLPFACHECRGPFQHPMETLCGHYFCAACIQQRFRTTSTRCPVCDKQTSGVLNKPTKLLAKAKAFGGFDALFNQKGRK